ncbi:hypothetical protein A4G99_23490 [Haladaptatus sp. R4]|nr:hypothetical protein A4G99_23490 [Haladaptatus sp. R4]
MSDSNRVTNRDIKTIPKHLWDSDHSLVNYIEPTNRESRERSLTFGFDGNGVPSTEFKCSDIIQMNSNIPTLGISRIAFFYSQCDAWWVNHGYLKWLLNKFVRAINRSRWSSERVLHAQLLVTSR